jgi:hypothetical protein
MAALRLAYVKVSSLDEIEGVRGSEGKRQRAHDLKEEPGSAGSDGQCILTSAGFGV